MKIEYKGKNIDPFEEYAKIKQQLNELEEKRKEMELIVQEALDADGLTNKITTYGHYYSMSRKSWEYSDKVKEKAKKLSELKKIEELKGIATLKKVSSYIMLDIKETMTKGGEK